MNVATDLGTEIAVAAFSAAGVAAAWVLKQIFEFLRKNADQNERLVEVLVDMIINTKFDEINIPNYISQDNIEKQKEMVASVPDYCPFIAPISSKPLFSDYREIRRRLDVDLMIACDIFIENSQLFYTYYNHLTSDAFIKLDVTRKQAAFDVLRLQGERVLKDGDAVLTAMKESESRLVGRALTKSTRAFGARPLRPLSQWSHNA